MVDASAGAEQFELIDDDPRQDVEIGPLELLREFRSAQRKHGNLITRPLASAILGVGTETIATWCNRGRLTNISIGPVRLVPGDEVEALYHERARGELSQGGRGHKLPSMAEVVRQGIKVTG